MVRYKNNADIAGGKYFAKVRAENKSVPKDMLALLIKQKYHIVGEHSAAKICKWADVSLKGEGECYKSRFYGISSHRCLQCTPVLSFCNHACVFCWRFMPEREKYGKPCDGFEWDGPEKVAAGLIAAQKEIVSGFGGNRKVLRKRYDEARRPMHVALSLTGEPAMYPKMSGLLEEFHERGMTTFLVTNGTFPQRLAGWKTLPTQLYVSMVAPNEKIYQKYIRPAQIGLWEEYYKTLGLMPELGKRCRTVLRMTLARGVNDLDLEGYARQIRTAMPHYVEVKSMVFVGGARTPGRGLSLGDMLEIGEVEKIAAALADLTGYMVTDRHAPSRVVLLCRDTAAEENRKIGWARD